MSTVQERWQGQNSRDFDATLISVQSADVTAALGRLDTLAKIMDSAFRLPGTEVSIGFDGLLGLVPVVGDAVSAAIGGYIIWEARKLGASRWVVARMSANTLLDTIVGSIPIVGDVFDVAYKSNRKNVALLRRHLDARGLSGQSAIDATYTVHKS